MKILFLFAFILIVGGAIAFLFENILFAKKKAQTSSYKYFVRRSFMTGSESALYYELLKQLPNGYHAFPKMRMADILETPNGHGYYRMRNKILPKHIDFLICDNYFKPVMAIELDGKSHRGGKQKVRDELKDRIFRDSGLELKRVRVGDDFASALHELTQSPPKTN